MGVRRKAIAALACSAGSVVLIGAQVGAPARASTQPVQPGVATAGAALFGVAPGVSGLTLTSTMGEAEAAYEETQSEATSASVDLGGLGYFLANEPFCGHTFPEKDQPQPLKANSGNGASSPSSGTPGVAQEQVSVSPRPEQARATTTLLSVSLPMILTVKGVSSASVAYRADTEQEADATVTADVTLLGGLVELNGMRWRASSHAGATETSSAAFTLGQVSIGGRPLGPANQSTAAEVDAINRAIGLLGFNVVLPASGSSEGTQSVGPLILHFSGSALDRTLVNPAVGAVTDLEASVNSRTTPGSDCTKLPQLLYNANNNAQSLVNLTLAIARGSGSVNFNIGGVNAGVQNLPSFVNPFGQSGPLANPLAGPSSALSGTAGLGAGPSSTSSPEWSGPSVASTGSSPAASGTGGPGAGSAGGSGPGGSQVAASQAGPAVCRTTSPAGSPGCWRGPASAAAALLLAGGGGVLAADVAYGHRRRRRRRRRPSMPGAER